MNRDEIRALIGGYATGSLTETERRILFDAALEDQELFDELAREQHLKELIDQPGARERLIRSMEPVPMIAWWRRPLPWIALAASVAGIAILMWPTRRPAEVAKLEAPRIEAPQVLPAPTSGPRAKTSQEKSSRDNAPAVPPTPVRSFAPPSAPKEPPPALSTGGLGGAVESEAKTSAQNAPRAADIRKDAAKAGTAEAPSPSVQVQARAMPMAAMETRAAAGTATGSLSATFGFHYAIDWAGDAVITANGDGYLSVTANQALVLPSAEVRAGSTTRVRVPPGSDSILIEFTASPADASLRDAPVTSTTASTGTIADPSPSANSKLRVRVAAKSPF